MFDKALQIAQRAKGGSLLNDVPGRTDRINTKVKSGSYVIPADIVSGLGEGNTIAGTKKLQHMFNSGPFGIKLPKLKVKKPKRKAFGGPIAGFSEPVPVVVAGGEYIIDPEHVRELGQGDIDAGHKALDEWVKTMRKDLINTLKRLPGPAKD
jgi:hypothetical protein